MSFLVQETEAGELAARQAELSERQRELMSGLQKEHTVQAQAMDQQASAASRIVRHPFQLFEALLLVECAS
jgi:hypothetical protein